MEFVFGKKNSILIWIILLVSIVVTLTGTTKISFFFAITAIGIIIIEITEKVPMKLDIDLKEKRANITYRDILGLRTVRKSFNCFELKYSYKKEKYIHGMRYVLRISTERQGRRKTIIKVNDNYVNLETLNNMADTLDDLKIKKD